MFEVMWVIKISTEKLCLYVFSLGILFIILIESPYEIIPLKMEFASYRKLTCV